MEDRLLAYGWVVLAALICAFVFWFTKEPGDKKTDEESEVKTDESETGKESIRSNAP